MRNAKQTRADSKPCFNRNGWDDHEIKLKVFSVPVTMIEKRGIQTAQDLWERIVYFPESFWPRRADTKSPFKGELRMGLATGVVETWGGIRKNIHGRQRHRKQSGF